MGRGIKAPGQDQGWAHRGPCLFGAEGAEASNSVVGGTKPFAWPSSPFTQRCLVTHSPRRLAPSRSRRSALQAACKGGGQTEEVRGGQRRQGPSRSAGVLDGAAGQGGSRSSLSRALSRPLFRQNLVACASSESATPNPLRGGRKLQLGPCARRGPGGGGFRVLEERPGGSPHPTDIWGRGRGHGAK